VEYTVQKLAEMAGISTRTLRYYDEVGILKPARINSSGYRIYGQKEVGKLQQILFYREMDVALDQIKEIMSAPDYDVIKELKEHRKKLLDKKIQLDKLICNVEKTIALKEGRITMTDDQKFEGLKQKMIDDNEKKYGKEIREKYGEHQVYQHNKKIKSMTKEQYQRVEELSFEVLETLKAAYATGEPSGDLAQKAADLHRQWLCFFWESYSKEAHAGIAQMYVDDERFTAYYDKEQPGAAKFLRDAILIYTGMDK